VKNPTAEEFDAAVISSYKGTFPKISLIRSIFGIEREFDRYYMRLKQLLRGNYTHQLRDANVIEYAVTRTFNQVWDEEENEYEELDEKETELVCFMSKQHKRDLDPDTMYNALAGDFEEAGGNGQRGKRKSNRIIRNESIASMLSAHSQDFFGSEDEEGYPLASTRPKFAERNYRQHPMQVEEEDSSEKEGSPPMKKAGSLYLLNA